MERPKKVGARRRLLGAYGFDVEEVDARTRLSRTGRPSPGTARGRREIFCNAETERVGLTALCCGSSWQWLSQWEKIFPRTIAVQTAERFEIRGLGEPPESACNLHV